jgi:cell division transport system permease protein
MYLLKLSLRPWRSAPFSQVFSSLAVGFLVFVCGLAFWVQSGMDPVLAQIESRQILTAYLDPTIDRKEEPKVVDSIRSALGAKALSATANGGSPLEIRFVGSEQFVDQLKAVYPDLSRELGDLGSEMNAIVPRYVSVTGSLPEGSLERVRKVGGVESADSSKDRNRHVVAAFSMLRWVARLLAAGMAIALLTGLVHLSRMNSFLHRETLAILRLWGASAAQLRLPSVCSGLSVGLVGGALAATAWALLGARLIEHLRALSPVLRGMPPAPGVWVLAALALTGAALGALAGVAGATGPAMNAPEGRG